MNVRNLALLLFAAAFAGAAFAMPTKDELTKALRKVGLRLQAEESALRSRMKSPTEAADDVVKMARESTSEAEKLLLIKGALGFYVRDGDEGKVLEALQVLQDEVPDIPPQHVLHIYGSAMGKRKTTKDSPLGSYVAKMAFDFRPAVVGECPRVVKIYPANGDTNVNPKASRIVVTFSQTMNGGHSFCQRGGSGQEHFPEMTGEPQWSADKTQVSFPVKLRPGWTYAACLNGERGANFRNVLGKPLGSYSYAFKTSGKEGLAEGVSQVEKCEPTNDVTNVSAVFKE